MIYILKESKNLDMSVYKWQLPVKQSNFTNTDWIHPKAKYHCFDKNGFSLCGKYWQDIYYFETDLEYDRFRSGELLEEAKCKKCKQLFDGLQKNNLVGENIGGKKNYD